MCGVTRIEDAQMAVAAGVDALGFIFAPNSVRCIQTGTAVHIISNLPPFVSSVGVFVNCQFEDLVQTVTSCRLSHVQLHGDEDPAYCERFARMQPLCRIIKVFRVSAASTAGEFTPYDDCVDGFLLDTYKKGMPGGTGEIFDWRIIPSLRMQRPVLLAGGLTPENVAEAVRTVRPFAVDVNSGVEDAPGIKNADKLFRLVREVRSADSSFFQRETTSASR